MGCGCSERRTMAKAAIDAMRNGDKGKAHENLLAMGYSIRQSVASMATGLRAPPPRLRVRPDVAKDYGLKDQNRN